MAYYLVTAAAKRERLQDLESRLGRDEFRPLRPFGNALTQSLRGARLRADGTVVWEEEDYCRPPLKEERAAVLDRYFDAIAVVAVREGEGWRQIAGLPRLFRAFAD